MSNIKSKNPDDSDGTDGMAIVDRGLGKRIDKLLVKVLPQFFVRYLISP
jgi:hypothetical protein